jgi:magnesium chelatase family protein
MGEAMALARLISRGQAGLEAYEVSVEVHIAGGLPGFTITGLPTAAVRESRDRVRAALHTCGVPIPAKRITVHLGPADIPKDGGRFDLAIALGIVAAEQQAGWDTDATEFIGELSLSGNLRPVTGVVPAALAARAAGRRLIIPERNAAEAAFVPGAHVYTASHFREVLEDIKGVTRLPRAKNSLRTEAPGAGCHVVHAGSLDDVKGHELAKRALTIAAAGQHNLLMVGPPGSGKSMLAERLPGLLPALTESERLSVACIASIAGGGEIRQLSTARPFRAPHHTTPATALVGGGARPRPGEVSLAHHGVLFLDELPEFSRSALEALREPLESGSVTISRVRQQIRYPARFQLVAAMNPCPCGYFGDGSERCGCSATRIRQYRSRISGPLLDRFDLHIPVIRIGFHALVADAESSHARLAGLVSKTRQHQLESRGTLNAALDGSKLWGAVTLDDAGKKLLARAEDRWRLSTRSIVRVLRVARSIADLEDATTTESGHIAEALQLRHLDRPSPADTL